MCRPGWVDGYVRIHMLLVDDGRQPSEVVVAQAWADTLAGFPGATVLEDGDVSAAFRTFPSWSPPTASWSYNSSGKPAGLSGDSGVIKSAANSWNGAGGLVVVVFGGRLHGRQSKHLCRRRRRRPERGWVGIRLLGRQHLGRDVHLVRSVHH